MPFTENLSFPSVYFPSELVFLDRAQDFNTNSGKLVGKFPCKIYYLPFLFLRTMKFMNKLSNIAYNIFKIAAIMYYYDISYKTRRIYVFRKQQSRIKNLRLPTMHANIGKPVEP